MVRFFCPVCGKRDCETLGTVCPGCRIESMSQRPEGSRYRTQGTCFYCDQESLLDEEHVVPLARGGPHEPWNLVRACSTCNGNKSDQLPSEWCPTHEAAIEIERRVPVIFPRMRFGGLIGNHAQGYARVRSLCVNFLYSIKTEMKATSSEGKSRILKTCGSVDRLRVYLDGVISESEARGINMEREEFRHRKFKI
jgi:hypothetical protein